MQRPTTLSKEAEGAAAEIQPALTLDRVIEAIPSGILVVGEEGRCLCVNAAAEAMFQISRAYWIGRLLRDVFPADSPLLSLIEDARRSQTTVADNDIELTSARFTLNHVAIEASPVSDLPGAVVVSLHDRRLERRMARQTAAEEAAQSARAVASMMAHEIKNPLSGIRGAAQLLESKLTDGDRVLAELIRDETDRIVNLVNSMEMFADDRPPAMCPVNIHEVLDHVRRLATHGFASGLKIRDRFDPSLPPVRANRDMLVQVFLNLVKNAAEACPTHGGEIVLSTGYQVGLRFGERNKGHRQRRQIIASVADNGGGIPERLQPALFDPFVSGRPGGKGLGLALVARLVRIHGGMIEFSSEPGRTIFTISLPIDSPESEESSK